MGIAQEVIDQRKRDQATSLERKARKSKEREKRTTTKREIEEDSSR